MHRRVWELLTEATTSRTPFTSMQLATVDRNKAPRCRTVILRSANEENRTLEFITDRESQKVAEIDNSPQVALTGYDPEGMQQLRLSGHAFIVHDEQRRQTSWSSLNPHTHVLYRSTLSPGHPISHPEESESAFSEASGTSAVSSRFTLIEIRLAHADWLSLHDTPHRRFQLQWNDGDVEGTWVVP